MSLDVIKDLNRKLFLAEGGEMTPVRIIHLCDMIGTVDYVNNFVKFESWIDKLFNFTVSLEKYNFFFIQSGKFFKWGAFCFAEKPSETVAEDSNFRFLIEFAETYNRQSLNDKDIEDAIGLWNESFNFENNYVESYLKAPYSVSMFSPGVLNS